MSDPIQGVLNHVIKHMLPDINRDLDQAIRNDNLDPLVNVAGGSEGGSAASVSYAIRDLTGLSSIQIDDLQIISASADPDDKSRLAGGLTVSAHVGSMSANISGSAHAGFLSAGASGKASITGARMTGIGSFQASVKDDQACIDNADLTSASVAVEGAHISIGGLGLLDDLLELLEQVAVTVLKGTIESLLADNVRATVNQQVERLVPRCTNL